MKIYKLKLNEISESDLNLWFDAMNNERKAEVNRLVNIKKRDLKTASDHLCKIALSDFCGCTSENILIEKNSFGKPFSPNLPVHFSISHSGNLVVCAVSENEIGIDIEEIRPINTKIAQKFATPQEIDYIDFQTNRLFEIWTLKEACFKCKGTGLGADIKDVSFKITSSEIICSDTEYKCSFANVENGYICSVCEKNDKNSGNLLF